MSAGSIWRTEVIGECLKMCLLFWKISIGWLICTLHQKYYCPDIKRGWDGWDCLIDLGIDWKAILKWTTKKWVSGYGWDPSC